MMYVRLMERNTYAETTEGIASPVVYRLPPPTLFDDDDPILAPTRTLRRAVKCWWETVEIICPEEAYAAQCFWEFLDELVERNVEMISTRTKLLDRITAEPPEPYETHYVTLKCLIPHPGKELSYPVKLNKPPAEERFVFLRPEPGDLAWVIMAQELFSQVDEFADYCAARFLDYEVIQAWTFLDSLSDTLIEYRKRAKRNEALQERLANGTAQLGNQPND